MGSMDGYIVFFVIIIFFLNLLSKHTCLQDGSLPQPQVQDTLVSASGNDPARRQSARAGQRGLLGKIIYGEGLDLCIGVVVVLQRNTGSDSDMMMWCV